ncbi:uncharacterized protein MONBRDRAFT_30876 [Monosiga brevicollis MX1]|uniref:Alpha-galactosidase n=1 Tax=Monosiga brevicollis TaxID=81824 RepID=A9UPV9_MONBE|nr:uncharacterized protein MONBRDRAFT_30876 [Monosiga brevicollis MX1]EDQ92942.1 predicted protein [Monosiga brevicollis MX1]|eukprot:XP_001742704.1 hypothetical protein [Monosiga brevicollis MX1]
MTTSWLVAVAGALILASMPGSQAYDNGRGRLPPMGWNTWCTDDACGALDICTEKEIMSVVDGIIEQGLDKLGYKYINMDDCWSAQTRNATGHLQPNAKQFPNGLKYLADYIHSKGLYFGLYTCVGTQTCRGGRPGSYGNYEKDAQTVADWGLDFIKADNCHRPSNLTEQEAYGNFSAALNATGRPMLFSTCEWGDQDVASWGGNVAQMWRIQMDHIPFWHFPPKAAGYGFGQGTADIIEYIATLNPSNLTGPYNWMDPDFLETLFPITMNFVDSRTEYSFWSLWSAPLLVATDLRNLSDEKRAIVANEEVIAIDQDELGQAGDRIFNHSDGSQVWRKNLQNGDLAVIFYNAHNSANASLINVTWTQLGLDTTDERDVRDVWAKTTIAEHISGWYGVRDLAPHDVRFYRLSKSAAAVDN